MPNKLPLLVRLPDGELEDIGTTFSVSGRAGAHRSRRRRGGRVMLRLQGRAPVTITAGESWPAPPATSVGRATAVVGPAAPATERAPTGLSRRLQHEPRLRTEAVERARRGLRRERVPRRPRMTFATPWLRCAGPEPRSGGSVCAFHRTAPRATRAQRTLPTCACSRCVKPVTMQRTRAAARRVSRPPSAGLPARRGGSAAPLIAAGVVWGGYSDDPASGAHSAAVATPGQPLSSHSM